MSDSTAEKIASRLEEISPFVQGLEPKTRGVFMVMLHLSLFTMTPIGLERLYAKLLSWKPGDKIEPLSKEELGLNVYTALPSLFAPAVAESASRARDKNMWGWQRLALLSSGSFVLGCLAVLGLQYVIGS